MASSLKFKDFIKEDVKRCEFLKDSRSWWRVKFLHEHEYSVWLYTLLLRKEEYYDRKNTMIGKIASTFYRIRKNRLGERLGFTIHKNVFGPGLRIWHYGNIVINACARVGKNCTLHGNNCIGNNGFGGKAPIIGDNVDIGFGAIIIGDVRIASNVIIGAGALVNKSFTEEGVVIAGVPAKVIKRIETAHDGSR